MSIILMKKNNLKHNEALIIDLFKSGNGSIQHVCKNYPYGIGWYTVRDILDKHNISYKNPRLVLNAQIEENIKKLIKEGNTFREISKQLNISYISVNKFCQRNQLVPKRHGNAIDYRLFEEKISKMAKDGMSKTAIANKLGLIRGSVDIIAKNRKIHIEDQTAIPLDMDDISNKIELEGYEFISTYKKHNKNIVKATHLKCGNIREADHRDYFKHNCKHCSYTGVSKGELEVRDWIQDELKINCTKHKIGRKEIDIYIPELKVGIEYCGIYWHSERFNLDKNRHLDKMKLANEHGIRLITIFEDEWAERQDQVKNFLKSVLNVNHLTVYARKCKVLEVDKKQAQKFLDENHIQGKANLAIAYGLFYKEDLVGLITGNKHHRQGHSNLFVLNRLAFKDGVQIVGGTSRLLKYLLTYAKDHRFSKCISWSDNRWSEGNVYEKCGFELTEELKPDYSYSVGGSLRKSKQSCKKKDLIKKGAVGGMSITERELALTLEYHRIWDCGKKRWEISL